ncbi:MAG TPA: type IX secretion system membrane protein PorP/SprF [Cyclobacteriaceae bacterium]|nr:type IX secretion system membrane protein PorP/SprF [Cyclobacteriaceae bacterium]
MRTLSTPLTLIILVVVSFAARAQQDPIQSQYLMNPLVLNPSYAGINNNMQVNAGYRLQWMGLDASPRTLNLNGAVSVVDNKAGVGATLLQDKIGATTITEFQAAFAYKLKLQNDITFSFGMQGGVLSFKTDNNQLHIRDAGDDAFPEGVTRSSNINLGAGATLMSEKFIVGLSVPRMLPSKVNSGSQQFELYNQHFYLFGSYIYNINERLRFKPTVLLRGVKGAPLSADVGLNLNLNLVHTAGIFVRNLNTYGVLLQTILSEKFRLGYVFELPSSKSVGSQFTTHEITLGIRTGVFNFHERSLTNF